MALDVVVIGSINQDVSVMSPRLPRPGETVLGTGHFLGPGGKGANQAVAAARLGASTGFVGRVGDDDWGRNMTEGLASESVDVSALSTDPERPTGLVRRTPARR